MRERETENEFDMRSFPRIKSEGKKLNDAICTFTTSANEKKNLLNLYKNVIRPFIHLMRVCVCVGVCVAALMEPSSGQKRKRLPLSPVSAAGRGVRTIRAI